MKSTQPADTDLVNEYTTEESKYDASSFEVAVHAGGKKNASLSPQN